MTQPCPAHAAALLWDLDNVTPPMRDLAEFAQLILDLSGPTTARYAAGTRSVSRAARPILEPLGFTVRSGGHRRNGADRVLLDEARRMQRQGADLFIIASNDHSFARLGPPAQLHVLTRNAVYLSVRLRERATTITTIPAPANGPLLLAAPLGAFAAQNGEHMPKMLSTERSRVRSVMCDGPRG